MITQLIIIFLGIFAVVSGFIFFWRSTSPYRWYVLCKTIGVFYLTVVYTVFIYDRWFNSDFLHNFMDMPNFINLYVRPAAILFLGWFSLDIYIRKWGKKW